MILHLLRLLTVAALLLPGLGRGAAADEWRAGLARVEITPPRPMWMSGYSSRDRPAQGTLTPLWAKVAVLEDSAGRRLALVTLDLVGIDRELSQELKRGIREAAGIEPARVALCCSHTHTGPVVNRNLRAMYLLALDDSQWSLIAEYAELLKANVVRAVQEAVADLRPAELSWGTGEATFAVNRRNNPEDEVTALRAAGQLQGPVDHTVPVLAIRREGQLSAAIFGYACHATVLSSYEWSGDYPGFAQIELERRHPGVQAMFWAGCGADQNPLPRREVELAREYGRQLAAAVDEVLGGPMMAIQGPSRAVLREIELPYATLPTRDDLDRLAASDTGYEGRRARLLLEQWGQDGELAAAYPYPVQVWRIGDAPAWALLGGEVVVDFALRLTADHPDQSVWAAGYVNDVMAYIPSLRVLREGRYEGGGAMVYYGLPSAWDESVEERIVTEVTRQVSETSAP
ncbi:MAG: neutral/alkaline non-lysosomal ceramidase N-terminal domain-containing protein [Planctomyces sp.]|nr:neutral/alkaline non-lysosomal ceramidase N-terminal domain-containing protein [Planctomyces sp.]